MKKGLKLALIIIGAIGLLVGLFFLSRLGNVKKVTYKEFINVSTYDQYIERYNHETELSVIYIGRPTCSACTYFMPTFKSVTTANKIDVYYINTDEINTNELDLIVNSDTFLSAGEWGTPLIMVVGQGEIKKYINDGGTDATALTDFFKTSGVL